MTVTVVNDVRLAPVGEDLTTDDLTLQIVRGWEKMHRVDLPMASGVSLGAGQWAALGSDGKLHACSGSAVPASFLVLGGNDRFDAKATGNATVIMSSQVVVMSARYDQTQSYVVGDYLTAKMTSGLLTKASGSDVKHALVMGVGAGVLTYMTLSV